jgi:hypothetical protein
MKRNLLIVLLGAVLASGVLSSYEHGPAYEGGLNRTGSQGGPASCSGGGCHNVNNPATVVGINVYNSFGTAVDHYTPGETYTVAITGHHTSSLSLSEFGFQVSAVNSAQNQAGTFAVTSGTHLRVTSLGGLQIVEHKEALDDSVTNYFVARFSWTAPAAGTGNVQFYGILNPFGGEGDDDDERVKKTSLFKMDDDDEDEESDTTCPNVAPVLTLTEGSGGTNEVAGIADDNSIVIYPNPCTTYFRIIIGNAADTADYTVTVYAANGTLMHKGDKLDVTVINFPPGLYHVVVSSQNSSVTRQVIKQ